MKYGKRQLILASLVLALGAAVYLNWQFAGTKVQSAGDVSEESACWQYLSTLEPL